MTTTVSMPSDIPALNMAQIAGRASYRAPGEVYLPELEAMHLIRCLRRQRYSDNKQARLRRHVMVVGPTDTAKSAIVTHFLKDLCGAVEYGLDNPDGMPTYTNLAGGASFEKLRGGVAEGRIAPPMLHKVDYCFASEMFSFIGNTPPMMMQKIDQLNPAMEEERIIVNQLKLAGVSEKEKDKFEAWAAESNVHYNRELNQIIYDCYSSFVFCTRFLKPDELQPMRDTGFLSRTVEGKWDPSQEILFHYHNDQFGEPDKTAEAYLRTFNEYAWKAEYKFINYPPVEYVKKVVFAINKQYWHIAKETGRPFYEVRRGRTYADVAQLLTVMALCRELEKQRGMGILKAVVDGLQYEPKDIDRVIQFRNHFISNVELEQQRLAREDSILEMANTELLVYLQKRIAIHEGDFGQEALELASSFKQSDLVNFICKTKNLSRVSAHNHIAKLKTAGYVNASAESVGKSPILHPSTSILEMVGFKSEEEKAAEMAASEETVELAALYELDPSEQAEIDAMVTMVPKSSETELN